MANRRVETPATHQAAQRSSQKRKLPTQTPIQSNDQENCEATANTQSNQQSKRQRRRVQKPGKAPRPEDVIVIDSSSEEEEEDAKPAAKATPTPAASSASTRPPRAPVTAATMEQLESEDYFIVLGLSRDATDADVKKAYRKLAIQWHPDKNRDHPRAEEFFKKIGEAYAVLSDPEKRKLYERRGKSGLNGVSEASGSPDDASRDSPDDFGGFYRHREFSSRRARDIFEAFFASMGMDPFAEFRSPHERRPSRNGPRQTNGYASNAYDNVHGDPGFGPGFGAGFGAMPMMMGFGGSRRGVGGVGGFSGFGGNGLLDSFFSDEFPGFSGSSGFGGVSGSGGASGFSSQSVSTSSFIDRSGLTVTKKTTTTVNADGRSETVTEEYRNGRLVDSSSTQAASRLAGAGRMHLDAGGGGQSSRDGQRRLQSGGRARSNRAL